MSRFTCFLAVAGVLLAIAGCSGIESQTTSNVPIVEQKSNGVWYEIFVRSFYDTNGDGIGDLNGVTAKLDYLKELGIGGIWLMPIQPSPSYHGYDVTDFYGVNPQYGTMADFKKLTDEAHKRGIKVILDMVFNHTSSQHPWFVDSAKGKGSAYRSWYLWAEDLGRSTSEPSAAGSGSAWHSRGNDSYMGIFWEGMPDLNFDHPEVRKEMVRVGQFWLKQGADGFRLDAAKHIYGDIARSTPDPLVSERNVAWWKEFRLGLNEVKPGAYLVGEVWDNSPAVLAPYLSALDSVFQFRVGDEIKKAVMSGSAGSLPITLERTYELYAKASGGKFVDAPFLFNHDQDRWMSVTGGDVAKAKLAAAVLLTLPGNPFLYYGEEIGMSGKKPDEWIREPMIWYAGGKSGPGQTRWEPSRYNAGADAPSVEAQQGQAGSLLERYRALIRLRGSSAALRDGGLEAFNAGKGTLLAYVRRTASERVLVIHNLSAVSETVVGQDAKAKLLWGDAGAGVKAGTITVPPMGTVIVKL